MGPESKIESRLTAKVRAAGGMSMKLISTGTGVPDRLVILPGTPVPRFFLIELKSARGRLSAKQRWWHGQAATTLGLLVVVLSSAAEVDAWCERYLDPTTTTPGDSVE